MTRILIGMALVLGLAACGAETPTETPASGWPSFDAPAASAQAADSAMPRACDLVSAAQAQAVLGAEASPMADEPETCLFAASSGVGELAMLTVTLLDGEDEASAMTLFNSLAGMPSTLGSLVNDAAGEKSRKSAQELEGLGDEAALSGSSMGEAFGRHGVGAQMLVVRKGTRLLSINVTGTSKLDGLAQRMQVLARDAVAKL